MRKPFSSLISYLGCIAMALFVTFVIEGTIGMILCYALVIALIISLLMTLAVLRSISLQANLAQYAVTKGDKLFFEIKLVNTSLLPAALVEVEMEISAHFAEEKESILMGSITGKGFNILSFHLTAIHGGKARVHIKGARLMDHLGIFSFKLKIPEALTEIGVAIYPNIPQVAVQTNLLGTTQLFAGDEEEEEESEEASAMPTGLPGYDHREYVPGDPIKRINWKMSSKRDIFMVRLDEQIKASGRFFLLDCPIVEENDINLSVRDNVTEGALAMLMSLLEEGREAMFYYCKQGLWMCAEIRAAQDVYGLQEALSDFEPAEKTDIIPPMLRQTGKTPICFTAAVNNNISSVEYIAAQRPDALIIGSYAASLPPVVANQWVLSDGFELSKV